MSREIKFRGKRAGGGEWIYGNLVYMHGLGDTWTTGIQMQSGDGYRAWASIEVEPETVGQYTGLKDKNGKEIYEGDIVRYKTISNSNIGKVCFDEYGQDGSGGEYRTITCLGFYIQRTKIFPAEWEIEMGYDASWREEESQISPVDHAEELDLEVIGNIYENTELLKS